MVSRDYKVRLPTVPADFEHPRCVLPSLHDDSQFSIPQDESSAFQSGSQKRSVGLIFILLLRVKTIFITILSTGPSTGGTETYAPRDAPDGRMLSNARQNRLVPAGKRRRLIAHVRLLEDADSSAVDGASQGRLARVKRALVNRIRVPFLETTSRHHE